MIISFDEKEDLVKFNIDSRLKITQQTGVGIELVEYVKSHMWKMQMTANSVVKDWKPFPSRFANFHSRQGCLLPPLYSASLILVREIRQGQNRNEKEEEVNCLHW